MDINSVADALVTGLSVVGSSSIAAAILPKPTTTALAIFKIVRAVVDFVGANWGNAKNN